ncbi:glycosyltransferase [Methanobrevibacter sp. TMH8]|uniref:glycosyltransferase family 2 protein n=1 Tax=Methanobrevibacter sp. TMH8 TaxID=2848611 RepID=UPI001CCCC3E0|nr:glycosyltransferase [Methanobrevibacter sp. TMH8]MBZ9570774.1 glycosyltransferase [Methanobrevibacter sp. TMH8]
MVIKVSVIIPVYNVGDYLEKCLDSVINQTLSDIEIICVNDGSTDNSPKILDRYAKLNSNIKVINKENGGAGSARNLGILHANGEYVGFVDGDDWISKDMYEKLYKNAQRYDSDMAMCPIQVVNADYNANLSYYTLEFFDESFNDRSFNHFDTKNFLFKITVTQSNKIYRNSLLKELRGELFPENLIFEDTIFFHKVYLNSKRVSLVRNFLYYYRFNRIGSTITSKNERYLDVLEIHKLLIDVFKDSGFFDLYKLDLFAYVISSSLSRYFMLEDDLREKFFPLLKKLCSRFILTDEELTDLYKVSKLKNIQKSKYYSEFEFRIECEEKRKKSNVKFKNLINKYSENLEKLKKERKKVKCLKNDIKYLKIDIKYLKSNKNWIKYKIKTLFKKLQINR